MESISLQCPVTIKVKVTEKFRAKMLDKMEKQLAEVDLKLSLERYRTRLFPSTFKVRRVI